MERLADSMYNASPLTVIGLLASFIVICALVGGPLYRTIDCLDGSEPRYVMVAVPADLQGNMTFMAVEDGTQPCR